MKWYKNIFSKKKKPKGKTAPKAKKPKVPSKSKTKSKINIQLFGKKPKNSKPNNTNNNGRFQRHFRKFHSPKTTGHPAYVIGEENKNFKIIGLTKAEITNGVENIHLDKNPEPGIKVKAYIRPKTDKINKGVKNERLKGWSFGESDKKKVQDIIDKDKNN